MNETLKILRERRSIRKYQSRQIEEEALKEILDAGTWAATAKGIQSAVMVAVQDSQTIAHMSRLNAEVWGKPSVDPFYGAPTVVVVLADGRENNWLQDGSLVMGNLMNAAWSLGIGSCWINQLHWLADNQVIKEKLLSLGLNEDETVTGGVVFGYIKNQPKTPLKRTGNKITRID